MLTEDKEEDKVPLTGMSHSGNLVFFFIFDAAWTCARSGVAEAS